MKDTVASSDAKRVCTISDIKLPKYTDTKAAITTLLHHYRISHDGLPLDCKARMFQPTEPASANTPYRTVVSNDSEQIKRQLLLTWQDGDEEIKINWIKVYPHKKAQITHGDYPTDKALHHLVFDVNYSEVPQDTSLLSQVKTIAQNSWQLILARIFDYHQKTIELGQYKLQGVSYYYQPEKKLSREEALSRRSALKFRRVMSFEKLLTNVHHRLESLHTIDITSLLADGLSTTLNLKGIPLTVAPHASTATNLTVSLNKEHTSTVKEALVATFPMLEPFVFTSPGTLVIDLHAFWLFAAPKLIKDFKREAERWPYLAAAYKHKSQISKYQHALISSPLQQALEQKYQLKLSQSPSLLLVMLMQASNKKALSTIANITPLQSIELDSYPSAHLTLKTATAFKIGLESSQIKLFIEQFNRTHTEKCRIIQPNIVLVPNQILFDSSTVQEMLKSFEKLLGNPNLEVIDKLETLLIASGATNISFAQLTDTLTELLSKISGKEEYAMVASDLKELAITLNYRPLNINDVFSQLRKLRSDYHLTLAQIKDDTNADNIYQQIVKTLKPIAQTQRRIYQRFDNTSFFNKSKIQKVESSTQTHEHSASPH